MIRHGLAVAGHGYPARIDGVGLVTDGFIMPGVPPAYPLRVALSVTYRGVGLSGSYRGVSVGVTE